MCVCEFLLTSYFRQWTSEWVLKFLCIYLYGHTQVQKKYIQYTESHNLDLEGKMG